MTKDIDPELAEALMEMAKKAAKMVGAPEPEAVYLLCREEKSMPEENPRDTQFAGFAKLVTDELKVTGGYPISEVRTIIARRAYDLVQHTVGYSLEYLDECGVELSGSMGKRIQPSIPDLTELPQEE